tara:strand:+ start:26331 stop:26501 length:171 start_codon:yes stop_codon:yes gene_type:complete
VKIVEVGKRDFCNVCHVFGCTQMIEFRAVLIEETPIFNVCKDCAEQIGKLSEDINE